MPSRASGVEPTATRTLGDLETVTIEQEMGTIWLPSRNRLLHKMAEITIGAADTPADIISIFWVNHIAEIPYYKRAELPDMHQLLVAGKLATKRLLGDAKKPLPENLRAIMALRNKNESLRIDIAGAHDCLLYRGEESTPTLARVWLADSEAPDVLRVQGGLVEEGVQVTANWGKTSPAGTQPVSFSRPNLTLMSN
jgi:hypothetical protein